MNRNFEFNWEFREFAIKTVEDDSGIKRNCPLELLKFKDKTYHTIAYWKLTDNGYELHFVGDRPFSEIDAEEIASIWRQLQAGQNMLNEYYEASMDEELHQFW